MGCDREKRPRDGVQMSTAEYNDGDNLWRIGARGGAAAVRRRSRRQQ